MNNCIGRRNHRSFVYFLFFATCYFVVDVVACLYRFFINPDILSIAMGGVSLLFCVVLCCSSTAMLCSNLYYIGRGVTTNEQVRKKWNDNNPYDLGYCNNCLDFFCRNNGLSILELKEACEKKLGLNENDEKRKIEIIQPAINPVIPPPSTNNISNNA